MLVFPAGLLALRLGLHITHQRPQSMCPWRTGEVKVVDLFDVPFFLPPLLPSLPSFFPPSSPRWLPAAHMVPCQKRERRCEML